MLQSDKGQGPELDGGRLRVGVVQARFNEGVTNGTKILAVGGMAYSEERMRTAIRAATDRRTPITLLVEKDGRYRTITPAWTQGLRYPHLERTGTGASLLDQVLLPRRAGFTPS